MTDKLEVKVIGANEIRSRLKKAGVKIGNNVGAGLIKGGLKLQNLSMKIVPVDTNTLRPTARTTPIGSGVDIDVIVSYATDYAVFVHERSDLKHKPGKSSKYLERPMRENGNEIFDAIVKGAKK